MNKMIPIKGLLAQLIIRNWIWVFLSISLGTSGAIFNGISVTLIVPLVLDLLGLNIIDSSSFPPILEKIFSVFDVFPEKYIPVAMIASIFIAVTLKSLTNYLNTLTSGHLSRKFASHLREESFRVLLEVDIDFFSTIKLGELMNYANGEVGRVSTGVRAIIRLLVSMINVFVFLGILLLISWKLTIITTVVVLLITLISQSFVTQSKLAGKELSDSSGMLSGKMIEVLSGIRLVKAVANEAKEYESIRQLITRREKAEFKTQNIAAALGALNEILNVFSLVIIIVAGRLTYVGDLQTFTSIILTYLLVLNRLMPLVAGIGGARSQLGSVASAVDNVERLLERESKPIMGSGSIGFSGVNSEIKFNDVWLRYSNSDQWSLQGIDLCLPKGNTLALVGASGAGKSTIADLVARFYDPTKGTVEIDGIDLKNYSLGEFRRKIGIVSQDTFLINASVRENLKYGCSDASDEDVFEAARQANALDFILDLPQGFETPIGGRGVLLSGGQRQRISIARALLQNPEILILDEATSALDTVSEKLIQDALESLRRERTTLVIAHRLSTVRNADVIMVLESGKVIESGTHGDLISLGGKYYQLCSMQSSSEQSIYEAESDQDASSSVPYTDLSYQVRSELNKMSGILGLLDEDSFESRSDYRLLLNTFSELARSIITSFEFVRGDYDKRLE